MKVLFGNQKYSYYTKQPNFKSNERIYERENGRLMGTISMIFRDDLHWANFVDMLDKNFQSQDKVNLLQVASSDGSEAYSQIMAIDRYSKNPKKFQILRGYDIDDEIIKAVHSKRINMTSLDVKSIKSRGIDFNKYFRLSSDRLFIPTKPNTLPAKYEYDTFDVLPSLLNRVQIEKADMFDVVANIVDNGNTTFLCRNVLGYFDENKINDFLCTLSQRLKSGSLLVIGNLECEVGNILNTIKKNNFYRIMYNVYRKI